MGLAGTHAARATPSTNSCAPRSRPGAIVVESNWRHNPWWTEVLESERQLDQKRYPERYGHIWEGEYARAFEGAYFASVLNAAKAEGRIGRVAADPLLPLRAFWDLGGSGATADAMAIWITQWVGQEVRVLDYIEGIGQVLAYYVNELRQRKYDKAICYLPHDGIDRQQHHRQALRRPSAGSRLRGAAANRQPRPWGGLHARRSTAPYLSQAVVQ